MKDSQSDKGPSFVAVSSDAASIVGEPLAYPDTPDPIISSFIVPIAAGAVTEWMTHPVPPYIYVLEGILSVEFAADGHVRTFEQGKAFLQARSQWHRGRNDTDRPIRFLSVFVGAKDVPVILHPPVVKPSQTDALDCPCLAARRMPQ
jgi:quercetin dioxygenase-like cupin family protein